MDIITTENLNLSCGDHHVLHDVTMNIQENEIIVTHNMQQAARVSDKTKAYVSGQFG